MTVLYRRLMAKQAGCYVPPFRGIPDAPFEGVPVVKAWKLDGLPERWVKRVNRTLRERFAQAPFVRDPRMAAIDRAWRDVEAMALAAGRNAVLPPNATDAQVVALAALCARKCSRQGVERIAGMRARCDGIASSVGVVPLEACADAPAVARYLDRRWWVRRLRQAHGIAIETAASRLGLVHRRADLYVSDDNLRRRIEQNKRNARILESVTATNGRGDTFTLAQLAARSVSNKAIRRGELMLRIRGMEDVATSAGHVALFAVLTCPSRMHAVVESGKFNPNHDGTTPRQAQAWHAGQWKRMTAALLRRQVGFYGARTVEPHHDGCPHWNVLLFVPASEISEVEALFLRYWLYAESPDEEGAREHRVHLTRIDASKGSATAYIAKYISKGIDGHGMREDLCGNPIVDTSMRIEAWARTWGIRQFQTMCSASVSVWRELRRVERQAVIDASPPDELIVAWNAAQRFTPPPAPVQSELPGMAAPGAKRADFAAFIAADGGPRVPREERRLSLDRKVIEGVNRYGEARPSMPCGVVAFGSVERYKAFDGIAALGTVKGYSWRVPRLAIVASVRHVWTLASAPMDSAFEVSAKELWSSVGGGLGVGVPRTRVNNYTRDDLGQEDSCGSEVDTEGFELGCSWLDEHRKLMEKMDDPPLGRSPPSSQMAVVTNAE